LRIEDVGVIGLGATGCTSARGLLENGFAVSVHDRNAWTAAGMVEAGARPARIPADAAEPADLVFVHVPDEAAAEEVLFDCGGVGETLRDGGFVVVASRTGPAFVRSAAARLGALGLNTVEAWFCRDAGSPATTAFVGCSPEHLETVAPALTAVAGTVLHVGPLGSVSALRTAVTALCELRQTVPGRVDDRGSGAASDRHRSGWPGQSAAALARAVAGALVDGGAARRVPSEAVGVPAPREGRPRSCVVPSTFPGVLTLQELMDVVDHVRGCDPGPRPASPVTAVEPPPDPTYLGLASSQFEDVITELERRCGIPLLTEARRTSTFVELVALVNSQVTSGV
jgi:hypothetical protein